MTTALGALPDATPIPPTSSTPSTAWRDILRVPGRIDQVDLESVISSFFPGDAEFAKTIVETIDAVMTSGDVHRWAELKRLDAHAAKHQRIATDHLLNLTSLLITRVCSLSGETHCGRFRDIVYDRIENFHNQCKDEIPQSVARHKARFEYLHSYNVKSYTSILSLVGTVLLKADLATASELAKRIASNHNHWFNFLHLVEFLKSLIEGLARDAPTAVELSTAVAPAMCLVISGICGIRLGMSPDTPPSLLDTTGVATPVWVGSTLIDLLEVSVKIGAKIRSGIVASALNALATLSYANQPGLGRMVLNRVIALAPELVDGSDPHGSEEMVNFLICVVKYVHVSEWHSLEIEFATKFIFSHFILPSAAVTSATSATSPSVAAVSPRLKALCLKWLRIMCYGPVVSTDTTRAASGSLLAWRALLSLDSPVFDFLVSCLADENATEATTLNAVELLRVIMQRDSLVVALFPKNELVPSVSLMVKPRGSIAPIALVLMKAFKLRRCRKACCYILHQCVLRSPGATRQVLYGADYEESKLEAKSITENLARVLLDSNWEAEVDMYAQLGSIGDIDFEALNLAESKTLSNFSTVTLSACNSVLETDWLFKLETWCEASDSPSAVNDRMEYWLVHDNFLSLSSDVQSVYHAFSARLLALLVLYESSSVFTAELLGLVETATGIINNDLEKELVAIDAVFLLLDAPPDDTQGSMADLEYLYALRVVAQSIDDPANRGVLMGFIQYRWVNRFSILRSLMSQSHEEVLPMMTALSQVTELLRVVAVELLVASQLVESDAEHVRNMRDFGSALIVADVARGRSAFVELIQTALTGLPVKHLVPRDTQFVLPELKDPRLDSTAAEKNEEILNYTTLTGLVDAVVAVLIEWAALTNESERVEVVSFLIESVDLLPEDEFYKFSIFAKVMPKLFSILQGGLAGPLLAFNLRTLKSFIREFDRSKNLRTRSGIIEAICYTAYPFVGSVEIWMIEKDAALCRKLIAAVFAFTFDVVESNGKLPLTSVTLPLTLVASLLATRQTFTAVEIVKELTTDRYRNQIAKVLATPGPVRDLIERVLDVVEKEVLFKELAI